MKFFFTLIFIIFSFQAVAEMTAKEIKPFTSLCQEEASTGFNWKNGKWHKTNFSEEKLIIKKLPVSQLGQNTPFCNSISESPKRVTDNIWYREGCYNVRNRNDEYSPVFSTICKEFYKENKFDSISCDTLFGPKIDFSPNGNFIATKVPVNIESAPKGDQKGSLSISVGFCSSIE